MKSKILFILTFVCITISIKAQLPAGTADIKGEAFIYLKEGQLTLKNYEKEDPIPTDGSFILYSSSYVYLTIQSGLGINSFSLTAIDIAGDFLVRVHEDVELKIVENSQANYEAAIKAGRMEIINEGGNITITDESSTRDYGLLIENSLILEGGHILTLPNSKKCGIKAGLYIKANNGVTMNINSDSIGIYSNSHIMIEGSASINTTSASENGAGILLEGNDTGIYLFTGTAAGNNININATSTNGYGIKIAGNGNIIAKGSYENSDWNTKLNATGIAGGIYLTGNGYIKADGAYIKGEKSGADGNISAIHAPKSIAAINQGKIDEVYKNANLQIVGGIYNITQKNPAVGNNMKDHTTYVWTSEPSGKIIITPEGIVGNEDLTDVTIIAERSNIKNNEYLKIDSTATNKSTHHITLEGNDISNKVTLDFYWFHEYAFSDLNSYGDIDAFIKAYLEEDYNGYFCTSENHVMTYGTTITLSDYTDIPSECIDNGYINITLVYPSLKEEIVLTNNIKVIVFMSNY